MKCRHHAVLSYCGAGASTLRLATQQTTSASQQRFATKGGRTSTAQPGQNNGAYIDGAVAATGEYHERGQRFCIRAQR